MNDKENSKDSTKECIYKYPYVSLCDSVYSSYSVLEHSNHSPLGGAWSAMSGPSIPTVRGPRPPTVSPWIAGVEFGCALDCKKKNKGFHLLVHKLHNTRDYSGPFAEYVLTIKLKEFLKCLTYQDT